MLQIDSELGECFYGNPQKEVEPERLLLAAMVLQALKDILVRPTFKPLEKPVSRETAWYRQHARQSYSLQKSQAMTWLLDERNPQKAMSFEWICHMLGYQPEVLRRRLLVTLGKLDDPMIRPFNVKAV